MNIVESNNYRVFVNKYEPKKDCEVNI